MKRRVKKDLSILNDIKIAHRGLSSDKHPENSLRAYRECIDKGIPIELDVHILKDNTLVVMHDDDTYRMTGKKVVLKSANYDDINDLKLSNSDCYIPTLKEVLDLVDGKVLLDIELKVEVRDFRICREICKYLDKYNGDFILKSFNPIYVWWFRKNRPNYIRGLLVSKLKGVKISKVVKAFFYKMPFNFLAKPDFVAFGYDGLPDKRIDKLYKSGIPILLFTIKDNDKIEYKYTGIIYEGN